MNNVKDSHVNVTELCEIKTTCMTYSMKWFMWLLWTCSTWNLLVFSWMRNERCLKMKHRRVTDSSPSFSLSSEHPPVLPAHGASILPPGPGVVWHDAWVPLESHYPDRERWPRGPSGTEEAGDAAGGEGDEGERPLAARALRLQRAHRLFCVCVCSCNRHLKGRLCMLTVSFFCLWKRISFRWLTLFMPEASTAS